VIQASSRQEQRLYAHLALLDIIKALPDKATATPHVRQASSRQVQPPHAQTATLDTTKTLPDKATATPHVK
jgi:hypothetical protein